LHRHSQWFGFIGFVEVVGLIGTKDGSRYRVQGEASA
jgi:hypothetical protein